MSEAFRQSKKYRAELLGRDEIEIDVSGDDVSSAKIKVIGCTETLSLVRKYQIQHGADCSKWPLPKGESHSEILLREVLMKLAGTWQFPYEHEELCHCRAVRTQIVDQAIIAGALDPETVSRRTSASTACGTCRPDVQKIIEFRTQHKK